MERENLHFMNRGKVKKLMEKRLKVVLRNKTYCHKVREKSKFMFLIYK